MLMLRHISVALWWKIKGEVIFLKTNQSLCEFDCANLQSLSLRICADSVLKKDSLPFSGWIKVADTPLPRLCFKEGLNVFRCLCNWNQVILGIGNRENSCKYSTSSWSPFQSSYIYMDQNYKQTKNPRFSIWNIAHFAVLSPGTPNFDPSPSASEGMEIHHCWLSSGQATFSYPRA